MAYGMVAVIGEGEENLKKIVFYALESRFFRKSRRKKKDIISEYCAGELFFGRTVLKNKKISLNHSTTNESFNSTLQQIQLIGIFHIIISSL